MPVTPAISRAERTSSHLCGFTTAVTSFICCRLSCSGPAPSCRDAPGGNRGDLAAPPAPAWLRRAPQQVSERRLVAVAGAHADHRVHRLHPHLAVADPAGLGGLHDDPHDVVDVRGLHDDLDPDIGHQRDVVLRAAVDLGRARLPAVAADLAHGHPGDAEGLPRLADLFPLVRLDHRGHELHAFTPRASASAWAFAVGRWLPVRDRPPPPEVAKSYADSACSTPSMPSTSSSSESRKPIVLAMTNPSPRVTTNE